MSENVKKTTETLTVQDLGPELMLYDAQKDEVHVLNGTARVVWEGLVAGRSQEEIEQDLRERFSIDLGRDVASDIRRVVQELNQKGLIKAI
jgi:PqqD family protein of HPr-rel-A system